MGIISNACQGLNQGISVCLSVTGIVVALVCGILLFLSACYNTWTLLGYVFFFMTSCKTVYDLGYAYAKLRREVDRLDSETDQLEHSVDILSVERRKFSEENDELKGRLSTLTKTNKELQELAKTLRVEQKNALRLVDTLKIENSEFKSNVDVLKEENGQLALVRTALTAQVEEYKQHNQSLSETAGDLYTQVQTQTKNNERQRLLLLDMESQKADLVRMLENSKKMVTNLILAGDDYKKFNTKFGDHLTQFGDGVTDLKEQTAILGKIANSLAKQVPDSRIANVQIARDVIVAGSTKEQKLMDVERRKQAKINEARGRLQLFGRALGQFKSNT